MINQLFNRLWVRFALAVIGIMFVVNVLPVASLLLISNQEMVIQSVDYVETLNTEADLGLTDRQIAVLGDSIADEIQAENFDGTSFVIITTLIAGILAGGLLGRGLSLPIERLVKATQAVGSRNLSHRVEVRGAKELRDLAHNFNQMTAELARSDRLRRNMMADVSHELLTPLTVMQGNLRAILDDVYDMTKDEIATLYSQNNHLIRLVKDLRQLAQAEAGQLQFQRISVDISELARETAASYMPAAEEKNITLDTELDTTLPLVQADVDRLRQVLHNLLTNALRHTPADGRITVQTKLAVDEIWLSISDSGEGIPLANQPHVFDRFYRTDESRRRDSGGAGLGLAISKAIIEAHNGRISASSPGQGQGTTFTIYLPVRSPLKHLGL